MSHFFANTSSGFWPQHHRFFGVLFRQGVAPMSETNASGRQAGELNPQGLRLEDLARILSAMGPKPVTVSMLQDDVADGAPTNPDGTFNLIQYLAWLLTEATGGGD
jgi:hypothetical protein